MSRIAFVTRVTYGSGRTYDCRLYHRYGLSITREKGRQEPDRIVISGYKESLHTTSFPGCELSIDPALAVPLAEAILAVANGHSREEQIDVAHGEIGRTAK